MHFEKRCPSEALQIARRSRLGVSRRAQAYRLQQQPRVPHLIEAIALQLCDVKTLSDLLQEALDFVGIV